MCSRVTDRFNRYSIGLKVVCRKENVLQASRLFPDILIFLCCYGYRTRITHSRHVAGTDPRPTFHATLMPMTYE